MLEALRAAGRSKPQEGGLSFCETSAVVRLVCPGWQAVYDALVRRLILRMETTDEAVGMLGRRFPAVTSVQVHERLWRHLRGDGRGRAGSVQPACAEVSQPQPLSQKYGRGGDSRKRQDCAKVSLPLHVCQHHQRGSAISEQHDCACFAQRRESSQQSPRPDPPGPPWLSLTEARVQALRSTTTAPSMHIEFPW